MTQEQIHTLIEAQKAFFKTNQTIPLPFRVQALKKLKQALLDNEESIADALKADLGKSASESYMCETGMVLSEISYMLKHLKSFAKEKRVLTPIAQFASRSYQKPCPYGVTLIMSPWNYPLLLTLDPLVDALAAGNTAIIKPSAYSPATSAVIKKIIESIFPGEYVAVITGGRTENTYLLDEDFDYIFFTGSKAVGTEVMEKSARHLTPVTLELGGKSPCIVDRTANIRLAAKRIVFGKYLNCGQTCVAPDYILCHNSVKDELIQCLKAEITGQFGANPLENPDYGKIINEKHFLRLSGLIPSEKIVHGGKTCKETCRIEPTVLNHITGEDAVMKEEIFGPILPIITYEEPAEVTEFIQSFDKPLALYLFSSDKNYIRHVTSTISYGGGCINDVVIHLATSRMGFGGIGGSGMGSYHGKIGFDTFSHTKSIVDKKTWIDLPMRYRPYKGFNNKLIRMFLK